MMLRWSTQRASNDRYKDHLGGQLTTRQMDQRMTIMSRKLHALYTSLFQIILAMAIFGNLWLPFASLANLHFPYLSQYRWSSNSTVFRKYANSRILCDVIDRHLTVRVLTASRISSWVRLKMMSLSKSQISRMLCS